MTRLLAALLVLGTAQAETTSLCHLGGDSIGQMIQAYLPCTHNTRVGAGAREIAGRIHPAPVVIISAGSNDVDNGQWAKVNANLALDRKAAEGSARVIWILPTNTSARDRVLAIAKAHGDLTVAFTPGGPRGQAHVHPGCAKCLAHDVLVEMAKP